MAFIFCLQDSKVLGSVSQFLTTREKLEMMLVNRKSSELFSSNAAWKILDFSRFSPVIVTDAVVGKFLQKYAGNIVELNLSFATKISNRTLQAVGVLLGISLTHLDLEGCFKNIDSTCIQYISHCKALRHINFAGCSQLSSASLIKFFQSCLYLESVCMSGCGGVDDSVLKQICSLKFMRKLAIDNCKVSSFSTLFRLLQCCGIKLEILSLQYQRVCSNDIIQCISENCGNLTHLNLYGCTSITDDGIKYLASCKKLKFLDLTLCTQITDVGVRNLCINLSELVHIDLSNCSLITDETVFIFLESCPRLAYISFFGAKSINENSIFLLQNQRPLVVIVNRIGARSVPHLMEIE